MTNASSPAAATIRLPALSAFWTTLAAILLGSLALRQNGAGADVSWLTSMCERMLDGERGWIDIFETTPPVPTFLYMPGVLLARAFDASTELTVFATAYAGSFLCLGLADRIAPKEIVGVGAARWTFILPAAFFLFVLSNGSFAQREHIAAAASLPIFAVLLKRSEDGVWPPIGERLLAAALAGFAFAVKPPLFALGFMALAAAELWRTRSLAFLFPSLLPVSAIVGVGLTAVSLAAFPAYLDGVTTLMRDVYVPVRAPFDFGALKGSLSGVLIAAVGCYVFRAPKTSPATLYALAVAGGFILVYAIQGKFFAYHLMPASLFALLALVFTIAPRIRTALGARPRLFGDVGIGILLAGAAAAMTHLGYKDPIDHRDNLDWAKGLDRPTAMAISPSISTSFPLAPQIGAVWVDRIHSQWVVHYARIMLARDDVGTTDRARYQRYYDAELERTRAVIREKRPEIILRVYAKDASWLTEALLERDPTLLDAYEPYAKRFPVEVLRRKDLSAPASP